MSLGAGVRRGRFKEITSTLRSMGSFSTKSPFNLGHSTLLGNVVLTVNNEALPWGFTVCRKELVIHVESIEEPLGSSFFVGSIGQVLI